MIKHIANIVTSFRILGSALLLFFPAFSVEFYIIYIIFGFTDMIDGTIARKTNSTNTTGAKMDTAADLVFAAVALFKILPRINVPRWLLMWVSIIAIIRISNIILGYIYKKQFIVQHTIMNKITGLLLFLLPLTLSFLEVKYSSIAVCSIATFSAIQEMIYNYRNQ